MSSRPDSGERLFYVREVLMVRYRVRFPRRNGGWIPIPNSKQRCQVLPRGGNNHLNIATNEFYVEHIFFVGRNFGISAIILISLVEYEKH